MRSRAATTLHPAPAALPRPAPTAPLERPTCEGHLHETSSEVHLRSPITPRRPDAAAGPGSSSFSPVFSSPALPRWNGQRFGFYPGLRTPQLPAAHARAEKGQRALARVLRLRPKPTSSSASHLNSCTITPHVVAGGLHRHRLHSCRLQLCRELPDRRDRRRHRLQVRRPVLLPRRRRHPDAHHRGLLLHVDPRDDLIAQLVVLVRIEE